MMCYYLNVPFLGQRVKEVPELVLEANSHEVTTAMSLKTDGKTRRRREVCILYSLGGQNYESDNNQPTNQQKN